MKYFSGQYKKGKIKSDGIGRKSREIKEIQNLNHFVPDIRVAGAVDINGLFTPPQRNLSIAKAFPKFSPMGWKSIGNREFSFWQIEKQAIPE